MIEGTCVRFVELGLTSERYWNARHETDCDMLELSIRENEDRHPQKMAIFSRQKSKLKFGANDNHEVNEARPFDLDKRQVDAALATLTVD